MAGAGKVAAGLPGGAVQLVDKAMLYKNLFAGKTPFAEKFRTTFGKDDVMGRINSVIRQANTGMMLYLADFSREALELDPHANAVATKRFGAMASLDYTLTPASGPGINPELATEIADVVRGHFRQMRGFRQAISDLAWGVFDGRSALETDWQYRPGKYPNVPAGLDWIHPRQLAFGPHRELCVIDTWRAGQSWWEPNGVPLDDIPGKFIRWLPRYFNDYPEREGLARRTIYWTYFKRFTALERMVFTELFGKPLRVVEWDMAPGTTISEESFDDAAAAAESLGGTTTANMSPGAKLKVWWPGGDNGGELYTKTIEQVDSQISRLWLGNEATTVAMPSGLGGNTATIAKGEQNIFLERDAGEISERIQEDLVKYDVLLNWGPDLLNHAPTFALRAREDVDRDAEQKRLDGAIKIGVPVKVSQYQEKVGIEVPSDDDVILVQGDSGRVRVVDQKAERDAAKAQGENEEDRVPLGTIALTPTDMAAVVTVNMALRGMGLPRLKTADGKDDPDGRLPVSAYRAKMDALVAQQVGAPAPGAPPGPGGAAPPSGAPPAGPSSKETPGGPPLPAEPDALTASRAPLLASASQPAHDHDQEQLVKRSTLEGARLSGAWAHILTASVPHEGDAHAVRHALQHAAASLPLGPFAALVERTLVRGAMLGAAEAHWELDHEPPEHAPALFDKEAPAVAGAPSGRPAGVGLPELDVRGTSALVGRPFHEAIAIFRQRSILGRAAFDRLLAEAKRRSFTIAKLARQDMLETAHEELTRSITDGTSLDDFREKLRERYEERGWTPLNDSHAQVVFRTATQSAYAAGRDVQMRQPDVLAARPYWQILGVKDHRTRPTHAAVHRLVLRADDPFWDDAPPPFGFSCRCHKVSRTEGDLERLGLTVTDGSTIQGLPDDGFDSESDGGLFERGDSLELARVVRAALLDLSTETEDEIRDYSGIKVRIDRPKGHVQEGVAADGTPWKRTYQVDYGEVHGTRRGARRTRGGDGEKLDVFCGPNTKAPMAYWITQHHDGGAFDEFKLMLGFDREADAIACYVAHVPLKHLAACHAQPVAMLRALLGLDPQIRAEAWRAHVALLLGGARARKPALLAGDQPRATDGRFGSGGGASVGDHPSGTVAQAPDLHGKTRAEADEALRALGAAVKSTAGGYTRYQFQDKSAIWIRPDGEVVRTPKPTRGADGARTNKGARVNSAGDATSEHRTGERVK